MSGMDLPLAVMIAIPEPWANNRSMSQKKKDFYQYYATMMEPWDGPASILFSRWRSAWELFWTAMACALPDTISQMTII